MVPKNSFNKRNRICFTLVVSTNDNKNTFPVSISQISQNKKLYMNHVQIK